MPSLDLFPLCKFALYSFKFTSTICCLSRSSNLPGRMAHSLVWLNRTGHFTSFNCWMSKMEMTAVQEVIERRECTLPSTNCTYPRKSLLLMKFVTGSNGTFAIAIGQECTAWKIEDSIIIKVNNTLRQVRLLCESERMNSNPFQFPSPSTHPYQYIISFPIQI